MHEPLDDERWNGVIHGCVWNIYTLLFICTVCFSTFYFWVMSCLCFFNIEYFRTISNIWIGPKTSAFWIKLSFFLHKLAKLRVFQWPELQTSKLHTISSSWCWLNHFHLQIKRRRGVNMDGSYSLTIRSGQALAWRLIDIHFKYIYIYNSVNLFVCVNCLTPIYLVYHEIWIVFV